MHPRRTAVVAVLAALTGIAACATPGASPLGDREFLSTSVTESGANRPLVPATRIRLSFDEGRLGISAGCNSMTGTYRVEDGRLLAGDGATTGLGCDPARHAQDEWLFAFIGSRPSLRIEGSELLLSTDETAIRLLDREVAEPDLALAGVTWTVVSVVSGDAVSSVPAGVVASLTIDATGSVQVATGCNQGGGRVTGDEATLVFSDVALTKRACDGDAGRMEASVLAVLLADRVSYRIDAGTLDLVAGGAGLQLQGVPLR